MRRVVQIAGRRCIDRQVISSFRTRPQIIAGPATARCILDLIHKPPAPRAFSTTVALANKESEERARNLSEKDAETHHEGLDEKTGQEKELQRRTPWHREGADKPPVRRLRSAGAMTKGKLLTTPSRLLKLILPLTTLDKNSDRKDIEPLALLVHPQQPLSYLERLIQSEIPMIKSKSGDWKAPQVHFRAEDSGRDEIKVDEQNEENSNDEAFGSTEEQGTDGLMVDGKLIKTGKISKEEVRNLKAEHSLRGGPGEGGVESYSGLGHEAENKAEPGEFVRWSSSTEIGDFIRDAARGKEFAVDIEGAEKEIRVGVPSFNDRTHYLRTRLRKASKKLESMAAIKTDCDKLANRSAQRLAMGGFGTLTAWWGAIYYFTFQTPYGWDTMEPITYLAGLSTIMLGYLYFLWHNREVSYRAALHLTVSHRQNQLYTSKGFDLHKWQTLIDDANALRKEIKAVANEYDVEWDETKDDVSETVHKALRDERKKQKNKGDREDEKEEDEEAKGKETKKNDD